MAKTKEIDDWDKQINESVDRRIAALTAPNKARRENLRDALNAAVNTGRAS